MGVVVVGRQVTRYGHNIDAITDAVFHQYVTQVHGQCQDVDPVVTARRAQVLVDVNERQVVITLKNRRFVITQCTI